MLRVFLFYSFAHSFVSFASISQLEVVIWQSSRGNRNFITMYFIDTTYVIVYLVHFQTMSELYLFFIYLYKSMHEIENSVCFSDIVSDKEEYVFKWSIIYKINYLFQWLLNCCLGKSCTI